MEVQSSAVMTTYKVSPAVENAVGSNIVSSISESLHQITEPLPPLIIKSYIVRFTSAVSASSKQISIIWGIAVRLSTTVIDTGTADDAQNTFVTTANTVVSPVTNIAGLLSSVANVGSTYHVTVPVLLLTRASTSVRSTVTMPFTSPHLSMLVGMATGVGTTIRSTGTVGDIHPALKTAAKTIELAETRKVFGKEMAFIPSVSRYQFTVPMPPLMIASDKVRSIGIVSPAGIHKSIDVV